MLNGKTMIFIIFILLKGFHLDLETINSFNERPRALSGVDNGAKHSPRLGQ